jgi:hypothetical protein
MTPWQWWATPTFCRGEGEWMLGEFESREDAIRAANHEFRPGTSFSIIEARASTDARHFDGNADIIPFVRTRNEEILTTSRKAVSA